MNNNDAKGTRKNNYDMSIMMEIKGQELDNLLRGPERKLKMIIQV